MSKLQAVYITDRDDHGELLDGLVAVVDDQLRRVELAPHLTVISDDGLTRTHGEIVERVLASLSDSRDTGEKP